MWLYVQTVIALDGSQSAKERYEYVCTSTWLCTYRVADAYKYMAGIRKPQLVGALKAPGSPRLLEYYSPPDHLFHSPFRMLLCSLCFLSYSGLEDLLFL